MVPDPRQRVEILNLRLALRSVATLLPVRVSRTICFPTLEAQYNAGRRLIARLAVLGIAFNALWPLLAHAAPQEPRKFAAPICATNGAVFAHDVKLLLSE